jgi:hypothetical protein
MSKDITELLQDWPYDPENNIRVIKVDDAREVMQVRQPMGIEQYELDGRPDGARPENKESMLEVINQNLSGYVLEHGSDEGFFISPENFLELQNEGILYYYRYLHLFQVNDYTRTARDTKHNLDICELVENYVNEENEPMSILQYKPYILRMHAVSQAMMSLHKNLNTMAKKILEIALQQIEEMDEIDTPAFKFEKIRSIQYLKSALRQVENQVSENDPLNHLRQRLQDAVDIEDYEQAAELRDKIEELSNIERPSNLE